MTRTSLHQQLQQQQQHLNEELAITYITVTMTIVITHRPIHGADLKHTYVFMYNTHFMFIDFYRATLYTARINAARCPSVCLSVRLSVTRRYCIEKTKYSIKLFHYRVVHSAAPVVG